MKEKKSSSISLVLPIYNEQGLIEKAVERCLEALSSDFEDFEIILIDDGSNDQTGEIIDQYAERNKQIRALHNKVNLNFGASIQRGIAAAQKDYILPTAIDLPLEPKDIASLIERMHCLDLLVLERRIYSGATLWRKVTSKINRLMLHIFFPSATANLRDLNYTQICRRAVVPMIMPLAKSPAFTLSEMILRAKYNKLRVDSADVDYHHREKGKAALGKPYDIIWAVSDMFRFWIKSLRGDMTNTARKVPRQCCR